MNTPSPAPSVATFDARIKALRNTDAALFVFNAARASHGLSPVDAIPGESKRHLSVVRGEGA